MHNYDPSPSEERLLKMLHPSLYKFPTYNEIAALNCAERCLQFDYPIDCLQLIIGDDSNDPDISQRIDAFAKKTPVPKSADAEHRL